MAEQTTPQEMPEQTPAPAPARKAAPAAAAAPQAEPTPAPPADAPVESVQDITFLSDVTVMATVELGRTSMPIRDVLKLRRGSVVELEKLVGQPAELMINNTPLARGEVIVINERFGFRITKFITPPA